MSRQVRPFIGINSDYVPAGKTGGALVRLHAGYCEAVYQAGGLPVILSHVLKEPELEDVLERIDGVVLVSGPHDMDPRRMGLKLHPATQPMPAKREDLDRLLIRLAMERQLPILAVGVGMHELNVMAGGTLFLHLPEDLPKSLPHKDPGGGPHRHAVLIEPGSRLEQVYGDPEIRVNSYHHQAVQQVAPGFRIAARAPDGVIEAIESEDPNWFGVGVQWHPHSETASALDMQLFEAFLQACVKKELILQMAA